MVKLTHCGLVTHSVQIMVKLTHCGLVAAYGDMNLGQHWLVYKLVAERRQAITWINVDLPSMRSAGIFIRTVLGITHNKLFENCIFEYTANELISHIFKRSVRFWTNRLNARLVTEGIGIYLDVGDDMSHHSSLNISRFQPIGHNFPDGIKSMLLKDNNCILIQMISVRLIPRGQIWIGPVLILVMD